MIYQQTLYPKHMPLLEMLEIPVVVVAAERKQNLVDSTIHRNTFNDA